MSGELGMKLVSAQTYSVSVCAHLLSCVQLLCDSMDCSPSVSSVFSQQEYRSGWPHPPPGDLLHPGIKRASPVLAGGFFTA